MGFVLDASVTMSWAFEDEATPYTDQVLGRIRQESANVPSIWPLEVANVLLYAVRRGRLSEAEVSRFVQLLQSLPISVHDVTTAEAFGPVLDLARRTGASIYDACYLELAIRRLLPLATADQRLRKAAEQLGISLV